MAGVLAREFLATVPHRPGVYLMRAGDDTILYVGKARDLRKRLASYARPPAQLPPKTARLVSRIARVETILTSTEKEALLLEATLIKRHRPRYNIVLRDDKDYPYLEVTVNEEWPRLVVRRRPGRTRGRLFGPFAAAGAMRTTMEVLQRHFPLRRCPGRRLRKRTRPCLDHQMGLCPAPCVGRADPAAYQANVASVLAVLEGKGRALVERLQGEMQAAAAALDFERAATLRDQLAALTATLERQAVVDDRSHDQDVVALARQETQVAVSFLFVRSGTVEGRRDFLFDDPVGDDDAVLAEVLARFYGGGHGVPHQILVDRDLEEGAGLAAWFSEEAGRKVTVHQPRRGQPRKLLELARANAGQALAAAVERQRRWQTLATALADALCLEKPPATVECIDISNLGSDQVVGSLVRFRDGKPEKSGYRHYRFTVDRPDDYATLGRLVAHRFDATHEANDFPDLLLVDGGRGQLAVVARQVAATAAAGRVALAGLAKGRGRGPDRVFLPGGAQPLALPPHDPVLLFLMRVRDEAHRFGIQTHRRLRRRAALGSELDGIPGVGPARRRALLRHFGGLAALKAAPVAAIAQVPGIGAGLAQVIHHHLHGGGQPAGE